MGKDAKAGGKGKGKQAAGGSDENAGKGKGKGGKEADGLGTCTYVKDRHVLCEKQGKINEAYKKLQDGWLDNGDKVGPAEFAKVKTFRPQLVAVRNESLVNELRDALADADYKPEIVAGEQGVIEVARHQTV